MSTRWSRFFPQPDYVCTALAVNIVDRDGASLAGFLKGSKWVVKQVRTCQETLDFLRREPVSVLLCEERVPDGNWKTLLRGLWEFANPPALIVVSNLADDRLWADVLSLGGYDVLLTPFDKGELFRVLFLAWTASNRQVERLSAGASPLPVNRAEDHGLNSLYASSGR